MPKILFSDLAIRSLKEGFYLDTRTPAFGIRVGKHRKTWIALKGKKSIKLRLGSYPSLSLADARRKALVALGTPYQPAHAPTFTTARDEFLALDRWKPSTKYQIERTLRRHFHWTKPLDKIAHQDVAAAIDAIEAKSEAAHALQDLKTFFNWCVPRYIPHSPCNGLKPDHKYTPRSRLPSDPEFKAIWNAASSMGAYGALVKILFTSGQRVGQLLDPNLVSIDSNQKLLTFPASIMKGNREHTIPYGPLTAPLLDELHVITNQGKRKGELDILCGVKNWVLHDARRFFSSTHAKLRTPIDCTEALLSHVSGSRSEIQRVYDHYDRLPERREAVARYEAYLSKILEEP